MLTLLTLSTTFVGPTLEKSYQAASHFCSGMALMLGPNFVGFDLKARRLYPTNMGFNPLDSIPRGIYLEYLLTFYLASLLTFFLASYLAFYLACLLTFYLA